MLTVSLLCPSQLYSLFLTAAASHVTEGQSNAAAWTAALHAGTEAMRRYVVINFCIKNFNCGKTF